MAEELIPRRRADEHLPAECMADYERAQHNLCVVTSCSYNESNPSGETVQMAASFFVLTFRIGGIACGIRADRVREILPIAATLQTPGQPSILAGFLNLRGVGLPIVRLATVLDLAERISLNSAIIVIEGQSSPGLLVDAVDDVIEVGSDDLRAVGSDQSMNGCAKAEFSIDNGNAILLDCDRLLLAEETRRMAELQGSVQRRLSKLEAV